MGNVVQDQLLTKIRCSAGAKSACLHTGNSTKFTRQEKEQTLKEFFAKPSESGSVQLCSTERPDKVLEELKLVPATDEHRNFILSTWVQSYSPVNRDTVYAVAKQVYRVSHQSFVRMEQRVSSFMYDLGRCYVLCTEDDSFTVHGWICGSKGNLHHCYVPPHLRRVGVAKSMIEIVCGNELVFTRPWPYNPGKNWEFVPMPLFLENVNVQ